MVSLFEICQQKPKWAHISTGVESLDDMISVSGTEAVMDFQCTPLHNAMFAAICNMMVTHLEGSERCIVAIETFNQFPWSLLTQHPRFQEKWSTRIKRFYLPTFAQVLSFFLADPLGPESSSALCVVVNFHEVVEHYRYQLFTTFEDTLLKQEIDNNARIIASKGKENLDSSSSSVPAHSRLLHESPWVRYQNHVDAMFKYINLHSVKTQSIILLLGCMDVKRRSFEGLSQGDRKSPSLSESSASEPPKHPVRKIVDSRGLFFEPTKYEHHKRGSPNSDLCEGKISQRVLFYNDWYSHSQHYRKFPYLGKSVEARMVAVAKSEKGGSGDNIYEPVYFDFNDKFYEADFREDGWLLDLSVTGDSDLSGFLEQSISSTQQQLRPPHERNPKRRKVVGVLPSSPVSWEKDGTQANHESSTLSSETTGHASVIDESDVESTGTLLDDL